MVAAEAVLRAAEAVEAHVHIWADAQSELELVASACASASMVEWSSRAGDAFRAVCEERTAEVGEAAALAGEVALVLRAHAAALRDLAAAIPGSQDELLPGIELPTLPGLPGLPNPLPGRVA